MSTPEWQANIHLTDAIVQNCITSQFPQLSPLTIKKIAEGWDNEVYLVNEQYIFRFPRRKIAVELIERENAVLKAVEFIRILEIPKIEFVGKPTNEYPYPFHGYKIIAGTMGCHANLPNNARENSISVLSTFLKQLHSVDSSNLTLLKAKPFVYDRTNQAQAVQSLTERTAKIAANSMAPLNLNVFQKELAKALTIKLPKTACLIHGDLYCKHLLFNNNLLTGIIDWGDCSLNSPAVDLAVIWSFYPSACHDTFLKIYGFVEKNTWDYARFLGLYSGITLLLYGHETQDNLLKTEAISSITRINPLLLL